MRYWDDFRTFDYYDKEEHPELLLEGSCELLTTC